MPIRFFNEDLPLPKLHKQKVIRWIKFCIETIHQKKTGNINFIFVSDNYLLNINKKYLNHNYYTDVITFDYCEKNKVSGDIFISIDRITENSEKLKTDFNEEMHRVMIHGILHLLGYNDKTIEEKQNIHKKEDEMLKHLS